MTFRIAVFTGDLSYAVVRTIASVIRAHSEVEVLVMHHIPVRSKQRVLRNQIRNLRRHGWRWIPYVASVALQRASARSPKAPRQVGGRYAAEAVLSSPQVMVRQYLSINHPDAVAELKAWRPDLGLSLAAPILKLPLFDVPRFGTLNIHKGKLPQYRGMPPAFWEILNGEKSVGVTVHKVDAGLDTGDILLEGEVRLEEFSTPAGVRVQLDELGVELVTRAVASVRSGKAEFRPQAPGGRTYTRPTLKQEQALDRRLGLPNSAKQRAKTAVFGTFSLLTRARPGRADHIVVLLYHRVSDEFRDSVTVGVEQFDCHMRYIADNFQCVSTSEIVGDAPLPTGGPLVAVTFDDGYRDNFLNAAPTLLRHGIPATFFISTDNIARNEPFEHDLKALGRGLPNMSWGEIRTMHTEGFTFGSHTASHVNLAQCTAETALFELERSRDALRVELGIDKPMFAYPFGKRADVTPERIAQVREVGYICNYSAYGGVNTRNVDRWDIRRQGVHYAFGIPALRAKILGWKRYNYV